MFYTEDGLLNEFKMHWHFRLRFPLHVVVFKQVSSHIPHEANCEQYFYRAGMLSGPNMAPERLATLVMVGVNLKRFKPTVEAIKERYYQKYRNLGGNGEDSENELVG